jgi:ribosomal-protein-alanine N-acetyltransferase
MILGKKVFLTPFTKKHLRSPRYLAWLRDATVTKYIGRPEYNKNITIEMLEKYFLKTSALKNCKFFAIHENKTKIFIGTAKVKFLEIAGQYENVADLGLMIGEKTFWGKGFGTDALQTLSLYAFRKMKARKLTGGVMAPNVGMAKAFRNVGFKIEGKLYKQIRLNNKFVDHILFGLTKKRN